MRSTPRSLVHVSIRRHLLIGIIAIAVLIGGVGGWAATTQISGAVIASGRLEVESDVKKVQHPTGGVVGMIAVHEGDRVKAGDLLIRLDETQTRANLAIVERSIDELEARQARLAAERDGLDAVAFPASLTSRGDDPEIASLMAGEQRLFEIRRNAREGRKDQLREQIRQLHEQIGGIEAQEQAKATEIEWTNRELEGVRSLYAQNLVQFARVTELERSEARLEGERGQLVASGAAAKGHISEIEVQILQVDQDLATEVGANLADIRAKLAELAERKVAAEDQLNRTEIRAPQDGLVHQLAVHTIGGVIQAGEPIMLIVPDNDALIVEAHVRPQDIDQLSLGQVASLRFTSFSGRTTPDLNGDVRMISPDISTDQKGSVFYTIRISVAPKELSKLGSVKLVPGMPVEAFIETTPRTVLSYFVRPLYDAMSKAFREG